MNNDNLFILSKKQNSFCEQLKILYISWFCPFKKNKNTIHKNTSSAICLFLKSDVSLEITKKKFSNN